jgi:cytochrome c oxidase subunit 1
MWIFGAKILGISSVLGAINFVVTILKMKHPDLPLMKISLFAWATLTTSFMIMVSLPTFAAALIMLYTDRLGVSGFFNPAMGGDPIAYQHLFWFTFHPEVYIFLIPAVGMLYEMIPKFSRKPIFSYQSGVTRLFCFQLSICIMGSSYACNGYELYRKDCFYGRNISSSSRLCHACV